MNMKMRIYHRYLGFFLAGIMAVYALSGMVLIFRNTDTFKVETEVNATLPDGTTVDNLGEAIRMRRLKVDEVKGGIAYFKDGTFNTKTLEVNYVKKELPYVLDKMTHLHKATSDRPLAFLNILFGVSLLFFVISSFWMFMPGTGVFKKGIYFALGGLVLALVLIFI